jgi:tetratricopeptide (TPR) repeat protein
VAVPNLRFPPAAPPLETAADVARARAEALHRQGLAHQEAGRLDDARAAYEGVLSAVPEAAVTRSNLGNVLRAQGALSDAIAMHRTALSVDPGYARGWVNLALALDEAGELDGAVTAARRAAEIAPGDPDVRHALGNAELAAGRPEVAIESFLMALQAHPRHGGALLNLAVALKEAGAMAAATTALETLIALEPENADAHFNMALNLLCGGDWVQGFAAYEWRLRIPGLRPPAPATPPWDGTAQPGATLLLLAEQGLGDTIQFVRFARRARALVGRIVIAAQAPLIPLLTNAAGIDAAIGLDAPLPAHDVHLPLMSLPFALGIAGEAGLAAPSWIATDAARERRWRQWLDDTVSPRALRVGIAWRGNPGYRKDAARSLTLDRFAALSRIPNVSLISLQKGPGEHELETLAAALPVVVPPALDRDGAFVDSAALMQSLDLIVASDSALAHLAGALGRPTWILLAHRPDWRWGNDAATTSWYPWATLLRQSRPGDWDAVLARAAAALAALTGAPS